MLIWQMSSLSSISVHAPVVKLENIIGDHTSVVKLENISGDHMTVIKLENFMKKTLWTKCVKYNYVGLWFSTSVLDADGETESYGSIIYACSAGIRFCPYFAGSCQPFEGLWPSRLLESSLKKKKKICRFWGWSGVTGEETVWRSIRHRWHPCWGVQRRERLHAHFCHSIYQGKVIFLVYSF